MNHQLTRDGLALLSQALAIDSNCPDARTAHFWMAVTAWKNGDTAKAKLHALKVRLNPSSGGGFAEDWRMAAQAEWILADNVRENLDPIFTAKFGPKFMDENKPR